MVDFAPEQYTPGGLSSSPDYTTYETDDSGPSLNWRLATPPAGEDGSIPNTAITVTGSPNPLPVQTGTVRKTP